MEIIKTIWEMILNNQAVVIPVLVTIFSALITLIFKKTIPNWKLKVVITQIFETIELLANGGNEKNITILNKLTERASINPKAKKALNYIKKSKLDNLEVVSHVTTSIVENADKFGKKIDTAKKMYKFGKGLFKGVLKLF